MNKRIILNVGHQQVLLQYSVKTTYALPFIWLCQTWIQAIIENSCFPSPFFFLFTSENWPESRLSFPSPPASLIAFHLSSRSKPSLKTLTPNTPQTSSRDLYFLQHCQQAEAFLLLPLTFCFILSRQSTSLPDDISGSYWGADLSAALTFS